MEFMTFLTKQIELMKNILACLEREKQALIHENPSDLLDIIEEKKGYIIVMESLEEKRKEVYPNLNIDKMQESGLLNHPLKEALHTLSGLAEQVNELQQTNAMLTQQSLEYTQQMITVLRGHQKPPTQAYSSNGKVGEKSKKDQAMFDQSV